MPWFVISTKPRHEDQVEKTFTEAGFAIYCPRYRKDRRVQPFFPGYAFLEFAFPGQFRLVRYTRGVKAVVGNKTGPTPIPEDALREIRARERDGLIELEKFGAAPAVGDEIEVAEGPLRGLRGVFQREVGDRERVMILLNYVSYQGMLLIEKDKLKRVPKR